MVDDDSSDGSDEDHPPLPFQSITVNANGRTDEGQDVNQGPPLKIPIPTIPQPATYGIQSSKGNENETEEVDLKTRLARINLKLDKSREACIEERQGCK